MLLWYADQFVFFSVLTVNLTVDDGVGHKRYCDGELVGGNENNWKQTLYNHEMLKWHGFSILILTDKT